MVQLPNGQQVLVQSQNVQSQVVTQSQQVATIVPPSYQEASKGESSPTTL